MSHEPADMRDGEPVDAASLLARAGGADAYARASRAAMLHDLLLPEAMRLDDQRRASLRTLIRAIVCTIGADIHAHAGRLLDQRGEADAARALAAVEARHILPGVMRCLGEDQRIAEDLIDRVTLDLIGEGLPAGLVDAPPLTGDRAVQQRLAALRQAEGRRRVAPDRPPYAIDLPAESHVRFVWWTTAVIARAAETDTLDQRAAVRRALAEGAERALVDHDEGETLEAAAVRLATLINAAPSALIDHCLGERRIVLLTACLAHALGIAYADVRAMIADPGDARLWLALRVLDLPRDIVARLGFALGEVDRRRDLEGFADRLDAIMTVTRRDAGAAIAELRLPGAFRDALHRLATMR